MFNRADFAQLAEVLGRIRGRFLLSLNDLPQVREVFRAFHLAEVSTTYTIAGGRSKGEGSRNELLISNWRWAG